MNDETKNPILAGEFIPARFKIISLNNKEIYSLLMNLAWDSGSITIYGFINYLNSINESSSLHYLAAIILSNPLCPLEGAYQTALFHNRRALKLDADNLIYLQYLLSFHTIPDKLIKKEEALEIAQEVLKRDPNSQIAKEILGE